MWAHLGAMLAHLGAMLAQLGAMVPHLGAMLAHLGGYAWGLCWPMLTHLEPQEPKNCKKWEEHKTLQNAGVFGGRGCRWLGQCAAACLGVPSGTIAGAGCRRLPTVRWSCWRCRGRWVVALADGALPPSHGLNVGFDIVASHGCCALHQEQFWKLQCMVGNGTPPRASKSP